MDDDRGASAFELAPEKCTYLLTRLDVERPDFSVAYGERPVYMSQSRPMPRGREPQCIQIWVHLRKSTRSDQMRYDNMRGKACLKELATQGDPMFFTFCYLLLTPTRFDVERPNTTRYHIWRGTCVRGQPRDCLLHTFSHGFVIFIIIFIHSESAHAQALASYIPVVTEF